jgi:tyrosyl-tRNA synthetase
VAMSSLRAELEFRGLIHQVTAPSLLEDIDHNHLTAYIGFDPTADSLHVGHLLQVLMLRRLQKHGHRPIAVAGGGTGLIGDPGGKSEERPLLAPDALEANLAGIRSQLERLLDFDVAAGDVRAVLLDNAQWLRDLKVLDFLRDVGKHFTVNQMVAKESVKARLERLEQGISFTEFSYMLLQAYDFLYLFDTKGCRLQLGASDQWGNITMGVDLVRRMRRTEVFGLTTPLLLKADGTKFGKTESGAVWLDPRRTSPYQLYQFFFRTEDAVVGTYLRYFTFLERQVMEVLDEATAVHPERREAQRVLAYNVCALVHGEAEATRARGASEALYSGALASLDESMLLDACAETPTSTQSRAALDDGGLELVDALVDAGLVASKSQARTVISQGGIYVNDHRRRDADARLRREDLVHGRYVVLRRGRDYHLVRFE